MSFILRAVALGVFLASASVALGAENAVIEVNDSRKDTEIRIGEFLKERLKIVSSLKKRGDDAEDLVLQFKLGANKQRGLPVIVFVIDTKVLGQDKNGNVTSQIIRMDSFSDIKPVADKVGGLVEWANKWNSRALPVRIYVGGSRIVSGRNLLTTKQAPLTENQVIAAFSTIVQLWPLLLKDLQAKGFVE